MIKQYDSLFDDIVHRSNVVGHFFRGETHNEQCFNLLSLRANAIREDIKKGLIKISPPDCQLKAKIKQ